MSRPANLQQVMLGGTTPARTSCQGAAGETETLLHAPGSVLPREYFLGAELRPALRDAQGDPGAPVPPPQYLGISLGHPVGMENYYP